MQSFDDAHLRFLGRSHSAEEAIEAVQAARHHFTKLNLDLITALPDQSLDHQRAQIAQALDLGVDHLSVYQLGIEPGTAFAAAVKHGDWQPMEADEAADFFEDAAAQITAAGFIHYEVSNFAQPGCEARHSLLGWQGHGYIGIGAGAHGRVVKMGFGTSAKPAATPRLICKAPWKSMSPSQTERLTERLIFGLRLTTGLPQDHPAWSLTRSERL